MGIQKAQSIMRQKQTDKLAAATESVSTDKQKEPKGAWRKHAAALEDYVQQASPKVEQTDVSDLPPELLKQLSVGLSDPLGAQLIEIFGDSGGCANLDQLLIGLYRKFHVVQNRRFLQNKIWRMVRKGQLHKAPDMRGMFCLSPPKEKKRKAKKK